MATFVVPGHPWQVEKRADAARPIAPAAAAPAATAPGTAPATNATAALGDSGGFGVGRLGGYCLW
jgi:hypothetical protein